MKKLFILAVLGLFLNACQIFDTNGNSASYTAITKNPWNFIQDQFSVNIPENNRILVEKDRILRNTSFFEKAIVSSEPYIYYIANQMHKNNMPLELALVPLIESVYNPLATSPVKAAGLWQFMPITAREYKMQRDKLFDARRDVIESTKGAISLLQDLNKRFDGDWLLVLAAYNAGEGRIKNAMNYNKVKGLPTDFWALDLPQDTMRYVPKLLAMIDVIKNQDKYGINLPDFSYQNSLVRIDLAKDMPLSKITEYSDISQQDLLRYNAGYIKKKVNGPFHLLVPYVYAEDLYQKLQENDFAKNEIVELLQDGAHHDTKFDFELTNNKYSQFSNEYVLYYEKLNNLNRKIKYLVRSGDNISTIAKKYKVKPTDILRWNNLKNNKIRAGQKLTLVINNVKVMHQTASVNTNTKPAASSKTSKPQPKRSTIVSTNNNRKIKYVIKNGDNLYSIAKNYRVEVNDILRWNNLKNVDIRAGDKLTINIASSGQL